MTAAVKPSSPNVRAGGAPVGGATTPCCLVRVKIISIEFLSDHKLLKDYTLDWTNDGSRFPKPEWTISNKHPLSHSMDQQVEIKVKLEISSTNGSSVTAELRGEDTDGLIFNKPGYAFKPGTHTVTLKSNEKLTKKLQKLRFRIMWESNNSSILISPLATNSIMYITMDKPVESGTPEDGLTIRRMEEAIKWVGYTSSLVPMEIVEDLFQAFPTYTLGNVDLNTLPENLKMEIQNDLPLRNTMRNAKYSAYTKDSVGGAWPLAQYVRYGGECQAIVRLIKGMLHQVGCQGTAEVKYVTANAADPYKPIIKDIGILCSGPNPNKRYALVDGEVIVGNFYEANKEVGWNNYEAYMKFTHNSDEAWFGGGVGKVLSNPIRADDYISLLEVFWGLAEYEMKTIVVGARQVRKRKVTKVWKY